MLRALILLLLISAAALLTAPILLSSLALDERGVSIPGRVFSKSETVTVHYSAWKRSPEVTFSYEPPDNPGIAFFKLTLAPDEYDRLQTGSSVTLHYLHRRDVPSVPLSDVLLQVHALPVVRLANRRTFTSFEQLFTPQVISALEVIAAIAALLFLLRISKSPLFGWVLGLALAAGLSLLMFYDFPRPTPAPLRSVREGSGRVKSVSRIDRIFAETHSQGILASQPVDVVGIEFVPAGRTESVLAVDLINSGFAAGLGPNATVPIEYEANSPRTAHIQGAARDFMSRNIFGAAIEGALCLAVLLGLFVFTRWAGRKRALQSDRYTSSPR